MNIEKQTYHAYRLARILKIPLSDLVNKVPQDHFETMAFDLNRRIRKSVDEKVGQFALSASLWLFNESFTFTEAKLIVAEALMEALGGPEFDDEDDFGVDIDSFQLVRHTDNSKFIGYAHSNGIFGEPIKLFKNKGLTYAMAG